MSTTIVVILFLLISLPIEYEVMVVLFRMMMLQSISGWITFYIGPEIYVEMFGTVSYTHLDVYKRQHQLFAGQQCQGGASPGSQDGADHAGSGQGQIHVSEQPGGGYSGSDGGRQLVCGQGCVGRNAREQVGRKGDQSSASADGVHEARQKDQRTDDEKHMRRHLHDKYLLL